MSKEMIGTILVAGLLLLAGGTAEAHDVKDGQHRPPAAKHADDYRRELSRHGYYNRRDYRGERYEDRRYENRHKEKRHKRAKKMPKWLKHNRSFKRWLRDSGFARNRHVSWHELFDLYLWDRSYRRYYRY